MTLNKSTPTIEQSQQVPLEKLKQLKTALLQNLMNGGIILGTVLFFSQLYFAIEGNDLTLLAISAILFAGLLLITFAGKFNFNIRSIAYSLILYLVGILSLINYGLNALGFIYFFLCVLLLGIFHNRTWWISSLVLITLTSVIIGSLIRSGSLLFGTAIIPVDSLFYWISEFSIMLFLFFIVAAPLNKYFQDLQLITIQFQIDQHANLLETNRLSEALAISSTALSQRAELQEKTKILLDKIDTFELTGDFLNKTVELLNEGYGFDYCGIFIADENREFAVLRAGTGEPGKEMLKRNHKLRIREEGMVGYVVARGDMRVANDVAADEFHKVNPILPETRSEIALPLRVGGKTIGALDFQSNQANAFSANELDMFQSLADQLTFILIKNGEIQRLSSRVDELQSTNSQAIRDYWRTHLRGTKKNLGFSFGNNALEKHDSMDNDEIDVLQKNQPRKLLAQEMDNPVSTLIIPISIRDQVLGVMNLKYKGNSIPIEVENLAQSLSEKLSVALENAQLLEEIQERVERESVLESISSKVRTAHDIDSILQATAAELGKTMGVDEVRIHLKTEEQA